MKLLTLRSFNRSMDAYLVKSKLESEGIECFLFNEISHNLGVKKGIGNSEIELKIWESDVQRALEILKEIDQTNYTDDSNQPILCPICNSPNVERSQQHASILTIILSALLAFIALIIPFYSNTKFRCLTCNHQFKCEPEKLKK